MKKLPIALAFVYAALSVFFLIANATAESPEKNSLAGQMVFIPAGHFIFGTDQTDTTAEALSLGIPKPWYADETPEKKIFLKGFYIDQFEVTNRHYKKYVDDIGAEPPQNWKNNNYPEGQGDHPIAWVTWYDAANYCQWAEKTLPSEKQWERAARGTSGKQYPWGDTFDIKAANLAHATGQKTKLKAIGEFPDGASPEGVHDLIGNVWEWVEDDYQPYPGNAYKSNYYAAGLKVIRGHSASDIGHFPGATYNSTLKKFARSGYRQYANPDEPVQDVGFRCASFDKPAGFKKSSFTDKASSGTQGNPTKNSLDKADSNTQSGTQNSLSKQTPTAKKTVVNPFEAKTNLPQSGFLALTFLAFVAGVFSFLSPCTLPILPAYFAVTAQADRTRLSLMSLAFFAGLATLFVIMGASASFLGQVLRDYMFSLATIGGVLVTIFGVMTIFGKGFSGANFQGRPGSTFFGFFLFGATFALGWTPCVGPILSGILILAASDKTVLQGMTLLFCYALGLGLPLIVIATFCGKLSKDGLFWRVLRGKEWAIPLGGKTFFLHSTNLFSGLLLIALGVALTMGYLTYINSLIPIEIQLWFSVLEEKVLHLFK
ncbi:Cytochrome c-type biogenesis protein CcdA (DsbD analog) [hydrothermal vent metagenome]|uniref:Cytochrome c-type biogenesis protein CcdA (DsbD analog) n=1 Tax=hydrothermal vent metagenome TaxID=652676 RepID=A0A3B1DTU9_9ZZZZ